MYSDLEKESFVFVDEFLNKLSSSKKGEWFNGMRLGTVGQMAKHLMDKHKLVTYRTDNRTSLADITPEGQKVIKVGGIENYITQLNEIEQRKENLQEILTQKELEKINLEIADLVDKLSDYSITKSNAKWALRLSAVTVVIAILALIVQIVKK